MFTLRDIKVYFLENQHSTNKNKFVFTLWPAASHSQSSLILWTGREYGIQFGIVLRTVNYLPNTSYLSAELKYNTNLLLLSSNTIHPMYTTLFHPRLPNDGSVLNSLKLTGLLNPYIESTWKIVWISDAKQRTEIIQLQLAMRVFEALPTKPGFTLHFLIYSKLGSR